MATHLFCDGIQRRDFLKIGALSGMGLGLSDYLGLAKANAATNATAKSAIYVRLAGGPSHMDTFDMKPDAPDTHRGEFREIATNVPGVRISEHLPKLAKCADKYAILRGVSHTLAAHRLGAEYLMTGNRPLPALKYPTYGAVVSKELSAPRDIPGSVAIPKGANASTGFLGLEYGPFETGASPKAGQPMNIRDLSLSNGLTLADIDRRNNLLKRYDTAFGSFVREDKVLSGMDAFSQKAYEMMRSNRTREAFDLTRESPSVSGMFGDGGFSQSCLLATRLVESGVRLVNVQLGGWDTHRDNFNHLKDNNLPNLDDGLTGLFRALEAKGLLKTTAVFVTGEFGRTPKINQRGGRDHYPRAMFCLLAGGGMEGGRVIGASDEKGEGPRDRVISPDDVAATFYHALGIDHTKEYHSPTGRPVMIVRHGKPIPELT
ncbi:MAG: DUF1501 domain-containing protein [Verrucomicrobiota bacterium]|jgi:hypothetical protein|nr:DUF1501 domain-containing protein [Verrucomicrobiota bacterium]MDP6252354.1 DUF1501 domain-containing protein [Verrucomicrobiota bacterium]MDP7178627.1 DUF1501 domain-containing protein [Verrucomicrobiota bacterium]MDP7441661.1 DUF1501 domain-containing protein [Verrucomicrobiota bacterium]HJN83890.1 DUF1501 domain-containing protein [Verrucomicrobiota bacterium]